MSSFKKPQLPWPRRVEGGVDSLQIGAGGAGVSPRRHCRGLRNDWWKTGRERSDVQRFQSSRWHGYYITQLGTFVTTQSTSRQTRHDKKMRLSMTRRCCPEICGVHSG